MEKPSIMIRGRSFGCNAQAPSNAQSIQAIHADGFISGASPVPVRHNYPAMARRDAQGETRHAVIPALKSRNIMQDASP
jgi:hypothetical protein